MAQNYQAAMVNKLANTGIGGDPFERFQKENPAPGMDTPYNPQSGSYASFLDQRAQRPDVQAWQKQAQDAFAQSMANRKFDDKIPGVFGAPGGQEVAAPAATSAPAAKQPFQSGNASVSGYLTDAMNAFAPQIRSIADEQGRKNALKDYLGEIAPEVQKRGGSLSYLSGDKGKVDGRTIDFFGDIEGAATPQYLDVTDQANAPQGGAMRPMFAGSTIAPALQGDAQANIQSALGQFGQAQDGSLIQQLIAKLQGGQ